MNIFTIGFTQKNAEQFFNLIKTNEVKTLVDVRLNNTSQLSGFAKKDDLKFFLKELVGCDYIHVPDLTPTKEILKPYQNKEITWQVYEDKFLGLMSNRKIERYVDAKWLNYGCLLCSEHEPHFCHRRLVLDYLKLHNPTIKEKHLIR